MTDSSMLVPGTPVVRTSGLRMDESARKTGWVYIGPANGGKRLTIAHPSGAILRYVYPSQIEVDEDALQRLCVLALAMRSAND